MFSNTSTVVGMFDICDAIGVQFLSLCSKLSSFWFAAQTYHDEDTAVGERASRLPGCCSLW